MKKGIKGRVFLFAVIFAALAAAADPAQENPSKSQTVLRVERRLIELNVVAQDSKGRAVLGLKRSDFRLFDNGKEVPIDVFSVAAERLPFAPTPIVLPANTFSNRAAECHGDSVRRP